MENFILGIVTVVLTFIELIGKGFFVTLGVIAAVALFSPML